MRPVFMLIVLASLLPQHWCSAEGRFRVLSLLQVPGFEYLEYRSPEGVTPLPVPLSSVSPFYPIPDERRLAAYQKVPHEGEERPAVLEIVFPDADGDVIILLTPGREPHAPYGYLVLEDSDAAFPAGSVLVYNLLKKPVAAKLGGEQVRFAHGERGVVRVVEPGAASFEGGVFFAAEFDGHGKIFSASEWYLAASMKIICILYADADGDPKVRRIRLVAN